MTYIRDIPTSPLNVSVAAFLAILTGFIGSNFYSGLQFLCLILIVIGLILAESNW